MHVPYISSSAAVVFGMHLLPECVYNIPWSPSVLGAFEKGTGAVAPFGGPLGDAGVSTLPDMGALVLIMSGAVLGQVVCCCLRRFITRTAVVPDTSTELGDDADAHDHFPISSASEGGSVTGTIVSALVRWCLGSFSIDDVVIYIVTTLVLTFIIKVVTDIIEKF